MPLMSRRLSTMLAQQVVNEYHNAYVYRQIAAWFDAAGFPKLVDHFLAQASDEDSHARKFWDLLLDMRENPEMKSVPAPVLPESALAAAEAAVLLEQKTNEDVTALLKQAKEDGNEIAYSGMLWAAEEQIKEVKEADDFLAAVKASGGNLILVQMWLDK